jgi:hypothetical protein
MPGDWKHQSTKIFKPRKKAKPKKGHDEPHSIIVSNFGGIE